MITVVNSSNDHGENENDGEDDQGLAKSDLRLRNMHLDWSPHLGIHSKLGEVVRRHKSPSGKIFLVRQCSVGAMMHSGKRQRKCYFKPGQNMGEKDIKP